MFIFPLFQPPPAPVLNGSAFGLTTFPFFLISLISCMSLASGVQIIVLFAIGLPPLETAQDSYYKESEGECTFLPQ